MPAEIFSGGMHNNICAMRQRPGLYRRRICIVDDGLRAAPPGNGADRSNIDQAHIRIGRGFEIDDFRLVRHGRFERDGIGQIDMANRDAKPAETVLEEREGAAIKRLVRDQLIAGAQDAP